MSNVEALEQAIQQLPRQDLAQFHRWFVQCDESAWDALARTGGRHAF